MANVYVCCLVVFISFFLSWFYPCAWANGSYILKFSAIYWKKNHKVNKTVWIPTTVHFSFYCFVLICFKRRFEIILLDYFKLRVYLVVRVLLEKKNHCLHSDIWKLGWEKKWCFIEGFIHSQLHHVKGKSIQFHLHRLTLFTRCLEGVNLYEVRLNLLKREIILQFF